MFSVGKSPDQEVDIHVAGNTVINVTEPAINFRLIGGRILAERNTITTGSVVGGAANPDAFRIVGSGDYLVTHNSIDCGWPEPTAAGINIFGQNISKTTSAIVVENDVTMSAPGGITFATNSAGIEVGGFAAGVEVMNNKIKGSAGAALAVSARNGASPGTTTFLSNDIAAFKGSIADVFVDAGSTGTLIVGPQMHVENRGSGTVVVPAQ